MREPEVYALAYGEYRGRTVEGFIKYFLAKVNEKRRTDSYQYYITDCIGSLASAKERWYDLINGDTVEENVQEQAEKAVQVLRDSFYGKGEK